MSSDQNHEKRLEKIAKINDLFSKFLNHIESAKAESDSQNSYINGYIACMMDVLEGIKDGNEDSLLIDVAKTKYESNLRRDVYEEVRVALANLHEAYEKAVG